MKRESIMKKCIAGLSALALVCSMSAVLQTAVAADAVLHSADFEGSTNGWTSFGASTVSSSTSASHGGNASLLVTGRTDSWQGAACEMGSVMTAGESYQFSAWVMQNASSSETIQLMAKYTTASGESYNSVASATCAKGEWVQLSGTIDLPGDTTDVLLYFQTDGTTANFYVDDVSITGKAGWSTAALDETPLKDIYANYFKIGCAATPAELSTVISQDVVKHHFNSLTVGNEMKPDYVLNKAATQSSGSNVNPVVSLDSAASVLKFCEDNGISVRGHVLVWYSQTPDWFFRENFSDTGAYVSKDIMSQRMENYIKNVMEAVATQFPKLDLYCWDVVNECYLDDGSLRKGGTNPSNEESLWTMIYGDNSYIEEAFTYARKYAPKDCKLFYNDFNEYIEPKRDAIYDMIADLKAKGLIDGVGMQSHLDTGYPSVSLYKQAIEKYAKLGLEIQVTELDITEYNQTADNIKKQTQAYKDIMQAIIDCKKNGANITAVCFWGITDGTSWRKDGCPLLLDADYAPKDTFYAVSGLIDKSEWGDGSGSGNSGDDEPPTTEPVETPDPDENGYYFHHTFEKDTEGWESRGAATLSVSEEAYEGSGALLASSREETWNGMGFSLDETVFVPGKAYSFSVDAAYFDGKETEPVAMKLAYVDSDGEAHYDSIAEATAVRGEWVQLANTSFTIPAGASDMVLYVETLDSLYDLYIDEAIGAAAGTEIEGPAELEFYLADLNYDGVVDVFDLVLAKRGVLYGFSANKYSTAADVDQNGTVTLSDIVQIQRFLLGVSTEFVSE